MVKIGSGGANFAGYVGDEWYNDQQFILCRLPLAQAEQYFPLYFLMQKNLWTGCGIRSEKIVGETDSSPGGLKQIV